ncbi:MAG: hypothetical protein WDO73_13820 [Ignavibacteriota bacterium]
MIIQLQRRFSAGLTIQTSYVLSKLLTNSDAAGGSLVLASPYAADFFNRGLEKSIGAFDVTHDFKFAGEYDLPFGKGEKFLTTGPASWVLGNWRISSINIYDSGTPVALTTTATLPIYASGASGRVAPYVTSYSGWQPSWSGGFDPGKNTFFVPYGTGPFPIQGTGTTLNGLGNATPLQSDGPPVREPE